VAKKDKGFWEWYDENKDHPKLLDAYKKYSEKVRAVKNRPEPKMIWASERYYQIKEAHDGDNV